jgi:hypothetical protein
MVSSASPNGPRIAPCLFVHRGNQPRSGRPTNPVKRIAVGDVPSARPTTAPEIDVESLVASERMQGLLLPADLAVPVRTATLPEALDHRASFLLLHVDGVSSLAQIAGCAGLPLPLVIATFMKLLDLGAVELVSPLQRGAEISSGVFPREALETRFAPPAKTEAPPASEENLRPTRRPLAR